MKFYNTSLALVSRRRRTDQEAAPESVTRKGHRVEVAEWLQGVDGFDQADGVTCNTQ